MRVSRGILIVVAAPIEIGFAHGGGSMSGGASDSMSGLQSRTPEDAAKSAYNAGLRSIKKAREYDADAAKAAKTTRAMARSVRHSRTTASTMWMDAEILRRTIEDWSKSRIGRRTPVSSACPRCATWR